MPCGCCVVPCARWCSALDWRGMGFTAATATALAGASAKVVEALGQHQESKALRRAAGATEQMARNRAASIRGIALENQRREQRNAQMELSHARADAAASNLLAEGSVAARETDLATRLEDEIAMRTNSALAEADLTQAQGALDAWNLRQQARNTKLGMVGSLLGGTGSLFSAGAPRSPRR